MAVSTPDQGDFLAQIDVIIATVDTDDINRSLLLLRVIKSAPKDEQPKLLKALFERMSDATTKGQSNETSLEVAITQNDLDILNERYAALTYNFVEFLVKEHPTVPEFYERLVDLLANPVFSSESAQAYFLYRLLLDRRIPYFQLEDGVKFSDNDWTAIALRQQEARQEIRFILASGQTQRSAEADLILRVIDRYQGMERIRLMGFLIWEIKDRERQAREGDN